MGTKVINLIYVSKGIVKKYCAYTNFFNISYNLLANWHTYAQYAYILLSFEQSRNLRKIHICLSQVSRIWFPAIISCWIVELIVLFLAFCYAPLHEDILSSELHFYWTLLLPQYRCNGTGVMSQKYCSTITAVLPILHWRS